ncbi:MAG TPA: type I polyketide synthase, partial [Ktedonobacteraceae bacterium]|nr:type I polyketide synthase [Ktedonobacteraceae bacterium]
MDREEKERGLEEAGNSGNMAIIGMSGRFPGADTLHDYWWNLQHGIESISFFSKQEVEREGIHPDLVTKSEYVKAGGILKGIEWFASAFFNIQPEEADLLDPQQRVLLECAWEALENAGYNNEKYRDSVGIYAGMSSSTYFLHNLYANPEVRRTVSELRLHHCNDKDYLATRIAYKLNLQGPSVNINTACSTSLVAVHLACQSLLHYECDIALVGGVSIAVPQKSGYLYTAEANFSSDGHCRAFDAAAEGTVPGNGAGIVVLKRLEEALEDNDYIHAIIKGSAINNDGAAKIGFTTPGVRGQAEAITEALDVAGVDPETISYIEAHGTGTPVGDAIEFTALCHAFSNKAKKTHYCAIGSVKTNIGHLDAAGGIAALIKVVLALKHGKLPPTLHFTQPNPRIDFTTSPFYINTELSEWRNERLPRRAGVNSYGIGGVNAHVILEEAPLQEASGPSRPWQLLLFSAKTPSALDAITQNFLAYFKEHPEVKLADAAYTYQVGFKLFDHRRMLLLQNNNDSISMPEETDSLHVSTIYRETQNLSVAFLFPGDGYPWISTGYELYQQEAVFREQIDQCLLLLRQLSDRDMFQQLYPIREQPTLSQGSSHKRFLELFITEYSLANLWMTWGVHPQTMIGDGMGEYTAACLAGVFSLQDALKISIFIEDLLEQLPEHATLHSTSVQPLLEKFHIFLRRHISFHAPTIPYISTVSGTWITPEDAIDPDYWTRHLTQEARFSDGIQALLQQDPGRILLEIGPGKALCPLVRQYAKEASCLPM